MPLSDGNPFVLTRLVPGVAYTGDLKFSRPFDNGGTSSINADGSTGGNEFTLDGSPNMANGRRVAFVPPAGAVQEFKVETSSFDAANGHTTGATVNVTLKGGTNRLAGSAYTYYRSDKLAESDFFVKKNGLAQGIQIYDPLTAQTVGARVVRQPFAGNNIPTNRLNPIAQKVLSYYPLPNQPADQSGLNNFFYSNPRSDDFYSISTRVDHNIS